MKRLEQLRQRAFEKTRFLGDMAFYTYFYSEYESNADLPEMERYAAAFYHAFSNMPAAIGEGELIVGNRDFVVEPHIQTAWKEKYSAIADAGWIKEGQDSHMAVDYELLLSQGINGILRQIDGYLQSCDTEKRPFYLCCKRCLEGIIRYAENYSAKATALALECNDPCRKAELETIAQICKKVPAQPAETFYEAIQSVHFITHCLTINPLRLCSQQFQLGHPDRYLLPYYERDIQSGSLTDEFAQLLIDCLAIQINMRVPNGLSSGYMVGGRDSDGKIVANPLTKMCMQAIDDVRLVYPAVGLCWTEDMPEEYLQLACEILLKGHSHPAIFCDDVITKGLIRYGVPEAQARNYIHSTCVEITPVGASNAWVASPYSNLNEFLLNIMDREYPSFEALLERYFQVLDQKIQDNFTSELANRRIRKEKSLNPLLSCFVNDCLSRGTDIEQGGARYNWIMPSFVGMGNLVDGLYAIEQLVFREKKLTLGQFKTILDSNYEGHEEFRAYILNELPKYGNDINAVDQLYQTIAQHIVNTCADLSDQSIYSNGQLIPSVFCWIMHEQIGRNTGATPDGRVAGFPMGDGSGPCQGREQKGPTASILSSTKWDHSPFIGGVAVNLKFAKSCLGPTSQNTLVSLVKTFMQLGGFETQINIVDNEPLRKAQKNPENYRDLVVRIGGYSDYFVKLSPQMQEEVILRTAHQI